MKRTFAGAATVFAACLMTSAVSLTAVVASPQTSRLNSAAQAALRHLATDEEICLADTNRFCNFKQLAADHTDRFHVARGITLSIVHLDGIDGYCLSATTATRHYMYDSQAGGVYAGSKCKVTTTGRSGGLRRGPTDVG